MKVSATTAASRWATKREEQKDFSTRLQTADLADHSMVFSSAAAAALKSLLSVLAVAEKALASFR
jgi:hypothetical protein